MYRAALGLTARRYTRLVFARTARLKMSAGDVRETQGQMDLDVERV